MRRARRRCGRPAVRKGRTGDPTAYLSSGETKPSRREGGGKGGGIGS